ncbi:uncharacterized protein [Nicotiana sylvestris]|uniref:uncharacterized protein n=1 Tax=Nicotiana sylvestris TaxID=4096 RepID=UPI00388C639A
MNEGDAPCLFNEVQQALNQASVLHHETFLQYRDELNQFEAEVRGLTEKRDAYKLLSEQREGEAKSLRVELEVARKENTDLVEKVKVFEVSDDQLNSVTNTPNPQVQQNLDQIDQLQAEMDVIKVNAEEWKSKMDRLASKKETTRAQLASTEVQHQVTKKKAVVQAKNIEELQSQLISAVFDRETLDKELETAKSVAVVAKADADEMVAQYKVDSKAAQDRSKDIIEHAKQQSRREALEKIHAWGFDLSVEIESDKGLEAEAEKLAYPEDDEGSKGLSGSADGGYPKAHGHKAGSGEDQSV